MPKIDTTVKKLVEMIRDGELSLHEMQRRYVWPPTRVRNLLDRSLNKWTLFRLFGQSLSEVKQIFNWASYC